MTTRKIVLICLGILLIAVIITYFIFTTEPTATSEGATRQTAMLVDVVQPEYGNFNPVITATGTVQPVEDVVLSAQVGGQIIRRSPGFVPGGFVKEGDVLLEIDPADYQNILELRRSELLQNQSNLEMEMGRQEVAEQDLKLAGIDSLSQTQRSLVLRKPQLEAVKATLRAARAAVDQAELDLSRTLIKAPFDAHVLSQNVTEGSQVALGDDLGRLVGSEHYRVILTVPVNQLQWLELPANEHERGSVAKIMNPTAWSSGTREGYLEKQVGALDDQTRLARVLVRVPDPLGRETDADNIPQLMIGAFVEVQLRGREISDVVRLDRNYVRNNQTVWVMQEGKLSIREVAIVLTDSDYAYIRKGLTGEEAVVTTNLSTVAEGISLRTEEMDTGENSGSEEVQEDDE